MMHTGFICGQLGGEPLVVEARGIAFGVCVTKLSERPWTHRGLCTKRLIYDEACYDEQIVLSLQKPMVQGEAVRMLQQALNALGYFAGAADGKCGEFTMSAVKEFAKAHMARMK
ncbi:MAG: peptidoglycan-binding protein [Clostridia bacterium]|nr:peptidoglycan-binding protein [Clostridia bacterium]